MKRIAVGSAGPVRIMRRGMDARLRMGVDLGGTKILAACFDADGHVVAKAKKKTKAHLGYRKVLERVAVVVHEALERADLAPADLPALGIGVPGPVPAGGTRVVRAANLGWGSEDVGRDLAVLFDGIPVAVGNDVNFGALGEVAYGCARDVDSAFALFLGTGLGGALIMHGEVAAGAHGLAGEIGHVPAPFRSDGECACGQRGCLETVASKAGILATIAARTAAGETCTLEDRQHLRASALRRACEAGDEPCRAGVRTAAAGVAWAIVAARAIADPDCFVLGGGIIEEFGDRFLAHVRKHLEDYRFFTATTDCDLRLAGLGDFAVAAGAARASEALW